MEHDKEKAVTPPYIAYKTLKTFFRSLSQALPSRIDKSVMPTMAGGVQSQVIQALKYLDLIESSGAPKDKLKLLVKSEAQEYQKVWRGIIASSYPFLASQEMDLSTATMSQLHEQFNKLANGETVRKCVTFFIPAAKDAGFQLSPFIKEPGKRSASTPNKPRKTRANTFGNGGYNDDAPLTPPPTVSWKEMLLSKFPSFDPSWPDDVKTKWFDSFNELMNRGGGSS